MSDEPAVATIDVSDTGKALATLTAAFIADPFFRWAYTDAEGYLDGFPKLITTYCGSGIGDGTAYSVSEFTGASIWLSPGKTTSGGAAGPVL